MWQREMRALCYRVRINVKTRKARIEADSNCTFQGNVSIDEDIY